MLIILRRLAEDIHIFDSGIDQKRKKEMSAALNEKITDVFSFILQNLEVCLPNSVYINAGQRR